MKRREFLNWVGLGALASSLPIAIAACDTTDSVDSVATPDDTPAATEAEVDSAPREDGFAAIGTVTELDEAGFVADADFAGTQVVVIRDPANADGLIAVDSLCTHQGCTVDWDSGGAVFACACHGSKFNPDGSVAEGPATSPVNTYDAMIDGDLVLVKVA